MVKTLDLNIGNEANLYFLGDLHIGTKNFDSDSLKKTITLIKKDNKAKVFLMGDMVEAIIPTDKRFDLDNIDPENITAEKQYNTVRKMLRPIKGKIVCILSGNHEEKLMKLTSFNLTSMLSEDLDTVDVGYSALVKVSNGKTIFLTHGAGCGTTLQGRVKALLNIVNNFKRKPDIVCMGHTHALQVINNAYLKDNLKTGVDYLALTGSYYKTYIDGEENYGSRKLYAPLPTGCIKFNFKKSGEVKGETIIFT